MLRRAPQALLSVTAIAAAVALSLSGCSSNPGKAPEMEEGPLSKYITALWDGEEYTQERYEAEQLQVEELVAACMQKEGFEYTPNVQSMGSIMTSEEMEGPEYGSKEFAEQYGYGNIDNPWNQEMEEPSEGGQETPDPNSTYFSSLSESEQTAYTEALNGYQPTEEEWAEMEESGEGFSPDISEQGCYGAAYAEVNQGTNNYTAAAEDPEFAELFEAMQNTGLDQDSDEVTKLDAEWASCMADSGYDQFKTPSDADMSIMKESNALYNYENLEEGEEPKEPSKKDLDALKKKEIELATTDFACRDKIDYETKMMKIAFASEQKFVDEHKAQLDAMLAKYQVSSDSKSKEK